MKDNKKYLLVGMAMLIIALIFISYAIRHPEGFFPYSLEITYTIYITYLGLTIYFIGKGLKKN